MTKPYHRPLLASSFLAIALVGATATAALGPKDGLNSETAIIPTSKTSLKFDPIVGKRLQDIKSLSMPERMLKAKAFGIIEGKEGIKGTVALSPREPWIDANTEMRADFALMVRPGEGSDGVITLSSETGAKLILEFRASANTDYLVDCHAARSGDYKVFSSTSTGTEPNERTIGSSDGHLTFAVQESTSMRDLVVLISRPGEFAVGRCEITEVR